MRRALLVTVIVFGIVASAACQERARQVGHGVCLPASRTGGATPSGAASGCRSIETGGPAWDEVWEMHLCGPCRFAYDAVQTARQRQAGHADACCYEALSPPPPPR